MPVISFFTTDNIISEEIAKNLNNATTNEFLLRNKSSMIDHGSLARWLHIRVSTSHAARNRFRDFSYHKFRTKIGSLCRKSFQISRETSLPFANNFRFYMQIEEIQKTCLISLYAYLNTRRKTSAYILKTSPDTNNNYQILALNFLFQNLQQR